ncbi:MAG: hypothetical protein AB7F79_04320 [Steroidobacteraceae bacterium]
MIQLLRMFVDIAIWRRGPQDLPASTILLWVVGGSYVMASAVQAAMRGWSAGATLLLLGIDLSMQAVWLWVLLAFFSQRERFLQTFTAFLGVNVLLTVLDVVITGLFGSLGMAVIGPNHPWPFVSLIIMLLSLGRVLQQALGRSLFLCMALTLVIMLTIAFAAQGIVPGA